MACDLNRDSYHRDVENFVSPRDDIFWENCRQNFDPWWSRVLIDHAVADDLRREHRVKERPQRDAIHQQVAHAVRTVDGRLFDKRMREFSCLAEILPLSYLQTFAPYYERICPQLADDIVRQRRMLISAIFRAMRIPNTDFCNKHRAIFTQSVIYFYTTETLVKMTKFYGIRLIAYADQSEAALVARVVALVRGLQILPADEVGSLFGQAEEYRNFLQILRALIVEFEIDLSGMMSVSAREIENILDIPACLLPVGVA